MAALGARYIAAGFAAMSRPTARSLLPVMGSCGVLHRRSVTR